MANPKKLTSISVDSSTCQTTYFAGSALTDLIDSDYGFNQIDLAKAGASAGIAFGLSWFGNAVPWGDIQFNKAAQFALSYDYALLGISNSIINVLEG